MLKKKPIILYFVGRVPKPAQIREGKAAGAQFRNKHLVNPENPEPCDYTMGEVPECYKEVPNYDAEAASGSEESNPTADSDSDPQNGSEDDAEFTYADLAEMPLEAMLELAKLNEVHLTKKDKKSEDSVRAAIADHFGLQE